MNMFNDWLTRRMMSAGGGGIPQGGDLSDYVQNGLILHWDGIQHGTSPNSWTDLIAGVTLAFESSTYDYFDANSAVKAAPSEFIFDQAGTLNDTTWQNLMDADTATVEVAFKCTNGQYTSGNRAYVLHGRKIMVVLEGSYIAISSSNNVTYTVSDFYMSNIISVNAARAMENGHAMTQSGTIDYFGGQNLNVGARVGSSDGRMAGHWYSIRFYSRQLTLDEMLQNQKVDNIRFNLGLNIQ